MCKMGIMSTTVLMVQVLLCDAARIMAEVCDYRGCFGFLLYSGAWESINSVQQNAPGRSTVVNISHHHHFPKATIEAVEENWLEKKLLCCKMLLHFSTANACHKRYTSVSIEPNKCMTRFSYLIWLEKPQNLYVEWKRAFLKLILHGGICWMKYFGFKAGLKGSAIRCYSENLKILLVNSETVCFSVCHVWLIF